MSREMKHSGIPWIGEIPKEWKIRKLRNLGVFSASGIDKKIIEGEQLVRIINYVDVYKNVDKELKQQEYMIVSAPAEKCKEHQVNVGDMIFTPSSETIEDIGISAVVMEDLPNTAFSYHVLRFQPKNSVDLRYRKYFTNNNYCLNYFSSCATGTIRKTISREVFKECLVILPPLSEQQKIASYLDRKCSEIDEMVVLQEKIIEELKAYKQSVITEAVTKGLNPDVPMKDSGIEWIGEIPENWEICRIKNVCSQNTNSLSEKEDSALEFDYVDIGSVSFEKGIFNTEHYKFKDAPSRARRKACYGDLIMSTVRTYLRAIDVIDTEVKANYIYSTGFAVLTPKSHISYKFLSYISKSQYFLEQVTMLSRGINYPSINSTDLMTITILHPPLSEQQSIASYLDEKCSEIDSLISIKQSKIESLKEYKKSIIYEYVTGKKEVI